MRQTKRLNSLLLASLVFALAALAVALVPGTRTGASAAEPPDPQTGVGPAALVVDQAVEASGFKATGDVEGQRGLFSSSVYGSAFQGNGSALTNLDPTKLSAGTAAISITGNANTATALAADGANCPAGQLAAGVSASGAAQGCAVPADAAHSFATDNTRTGSLALDSNTSGSRNTATGASALKTNTTGSRNTATGTFALFYNESGSNNTASGYLALFKNTTGTQNTAAGTESLRYNTEGFNNTAVGHISLRGNTTGARNTGVAGRALWRTTTGNNNTGIGYRALSYNVGGDNNTAVGMDALYFATGSRNTALGHGAGTSSETGSDNIFLGRAAFGSAADTNTIRIGGTTVGSGTNQQNRTFINGIRGVTTGVANAVTVLIDPSGQLGTASSSRRYKEDIHDMAEASEGLLELRPVTFRYKKAFADGERPIQFGLVAEEVAEVFPELVVYGEDGRPETVKYHLLSTLLLNELQKQRAELAELRATRARMAEQEAALRELSGRLERLETEGAARGVRTARARR